MPWRVEKRGEKYAVLKKGSGDMVAMHPSNAAAQAQVKALYANFNEGGQKMPKTRNAKQIRLQSAATRRNRLKTPVSDAPPFKKKKLKTDTQYDFATGIKPPKKLPRGPGPGITNNGVGSYTGGNAGSSPVGNKLGMVGGTSGQFESKTFDKGYYHNGKTIGR